ncbi:MAG: bifunctional oligoribonuclease/PAP phosphatase NrnA [Nitrospinae bacterium]|nr:bifunctional oligoribonuclease/PAP phosphatase NrnA [Nitrospinota bacterium]
MEEKRKAIAQLIQKHQRFLIATHMNPDGDGVGSEIALALFLKRLGRDVEVCNETPLPRVFGFLDPEGEVEHFDPIRQKGATYSGDVIFILDIANWDRLGAMRDYVMNSSAAKLCIDHHASPGLEGCLNLIDPQACATGELVYDLIRSMGGQPEQRCAEALYVAIMTDTGSFRFQNTTPKTHRIAAHLLEAGADPSYIYQQVHEQSSYGRLRLLGAALVDLKTEEKNRLAWVKVTQAMMQQYGVENDELEGFVELPRSLRGVDLVILFLEAPQGMVRVSLRSKGNIDVHELASRFGGGGHNRASGIHLFAPLDEAIEKVLMEARKAVRSQK